MYEVKIEKDRCKGCGLCIEFCPQKNLEFSKDLNKRGVKYAVFNKNKKCIGCKFCYLMCPDSCIEIYER